MEARATSGNEPVSIFQSDLPIEAKLERSRTELLDLSARNRLLNMPRSAKSAKTLEIIDELGAEVFRLLVRESRPFTFLPGKGAIVEDEDGEEIIAELALPEDEGVDARGLASRHVDTRLQTRLTPAGLQKRLLELYYDARTLEEEQGVNILFLAIGTLRWLDPNNAASTRHAPLLLVPVELERGNAAEKFKLRVRPEDYAANLSLEAYLDRVHGLKLPTFEACDEFDVSAYAASVADAVSAKAGWSVDEDDIVLGFFSFAKFLMYRDLDPHNWPPGAGLSEHPLIRPLVTDGFAEGALLVSEDDSVDAHVSPADLVHIVDSDSSQTLAIEDIRRGRDLVIQGPPGTGKSQTIANVIAAAVADGKTVLFVAEKMAALEVVKRRLDGAGVGDACLELHSSKANKRAVLEELRRTWELRAPRSENVDSLNARLADVRDLLNLHAERLHAPLGAAGFTPYEVVGHLVRLRQAGVRPGDLRLDGADAWARAAFDVRSRLVTELAERVLDLGAPGEHLWRGVELDRALPPELERLCARLGELCERLASIRAEYEQISIALEAAPPRTLSDCAPLAAIAARLATAPELEPGALAADAWNNPAPLRNLLAAGLEHAALRTRLAPIFSEAAWNADLEPIRAAIAPLAPSTPYETFERAVRATEQLPELLDRGRRLAEAIGREARPIDLRGLERLAQISERVAAAPHADPATFAQDLWDTGVERAADLAAAVATLEAARAEVGSAFSEVAWSTDLSDARRSLAAYGPSFLRLFSGEWRAADRLVRSVLSDPNAPHERRLAWLDALARGQGALKLIRDEADFGRSAFGSDWRGERSVSAPLLALVEWMRSLQGLGAEPRLAAGRCPDRNRVDDLARGLGRAVAPARSMLVALFDDLGARSEVLFADAVSAEAANLNVASECCAQIAAAHRAFAMIAHLPDLAFAERREALDALARGQVLASRLASAEAEGRAAFGRAWSGSEANWAELSEVADWIGANVDIRLLAARTRDRTVLSARSQGALVASDGWIADARALLGDLKATAQAAIAPESLASLPLEQLASRVMAWRDGGELLTSWVGYRARAQEGINLGLADLVERLHDRQLAPASAHDDFEQAFFEVVLAMQVEAVPDLVSFDGELHSRRVREFVDLDRQRIRAAAGEVARAHHARVPSMTGGSIGPLGVLKGEIARKRGHMPIRQLMQKAAPAVQAIKPVFIMSPLSVAQFLPPGALTFDLLVMDEASQIQPVDALGAIARCRQVVVVGDPQQLPPTAFFSKVTSQMDGDDEGAATVSDIESILGLFTARGLPLRMLRWHYRSRHESLIAISNRQFYENKLVIVPSPFTAQSGLGLRFHHVKDGVFETGTSRTNPVEADVVARAIIQHARTAPEQSLGVVAFSATQRKAILERLEMLRRTLPVADEAFFQAHPTEPFFVKNLENVQGDERDVILISIGYGPTASGGRPPMRFGPVGSEGGERRLNVLISRAKRRCEVFSSMSDEDIDPDFASTRKGVFALKLFMHFARTGRMSLAESVGRDRGSVFEAQVAQALHERGYQVHRDVGVSGLFIDIAVADPDHPDRYLLAIECDGPSYRSARSARDRDRLRRSVLEGQGWLVHRIWSGDWFKRPQEQLERTIKAIEAAKVDLARDSAEVSRRTPYEIFSVEREDVTEMGVACVQEGEASLSVPYREASLTHPPNLEGELHAAPTGVLAHMADEVVSIEGPVHFDEIVARIRDAWGRGRAGGRIREAVRRAVDTSTNRGILVRAGDFYALPGGRVLVRDRSAATSATLRRPESLPPMEIELALIEVASRNFGATDDQSIQAVARALGFKATSAQLKDAIAGVLQRALDKGVLVRRDALVDVGPNAPLRVEPQRRPALERLISEGEGELLEFKETLRWDVRQCSINKKLADSALKAIAAFANHRGGTLLIGVGDDGAVLGIGPDLATFGESRDKFELHLTELIKGRFSESFRAGCVSVSYPCIGDRIVCRVDVKRSRKPVYLTIADGNGPALERLIVRAGASSPEIPLGQVAAYVNEHFDH